MTVRVGGKAHTFVFDTGTRHTTVSDAVARTLARPIRENRPGERAIDDVSLEVFGMMLPHQTLRLAPEQIPGDGILGADLCKRFIVRVNFRGRRIELWPLSTAIDTRHARVVPADFSHDVPLIAVTVRASGVNEAPATLVVGLAVPPGTVSFGYSYAADSGLLDASDDEVVPVELRGITSTSIVAAARLPREPGRVAPLFADGVVSARALTASWIVFDAPRGRIVLGQ